MGQASVISASPTQMIWVQREDEFFDFGLEPSEVTAAAWAEVSEWESDFDTP